MDRTGAEVDRTRQAAERPHHIAGRDVVRDVVADLEAGVEGIVDGVRVPAGSDFLEIAACKQLVLFGRGHGALLWRTLMLAASHTGEQPCAGGGSLLP